MGIQNADIHASSPVEPIQPKYQVRIQVSHRPKTHHEVTSVKATNLWQQLQDPLPIHFSSDMKHGICHSLNRMLQYVDSTPWVFSRILFPSECFFSWTLGTQIPVNFKKEKEKDTKQEQELEWPYPSISCDNLPHGFSKYKRRNSKKILLQSSYLLR